MKRIFKAMLKASNFNPTAVLYDFFKALLIYLIATSFALCLVGAEVIHDNIRNVYPWRSRNLCNYKRLFLGNRSFCWRCNRREFLFHLSVLFTEFHHYRLSNHIRGSSADFHTDQHVDREGQKSRCHFFIRKEMGGNAE